MAAILFSAGDQREMLPHSHLMIHDPRITGGLQGAALQLSGEVERIMKTREITANLLAQRSGHTLEEIYAKTSQDSWFTAEEAVSFGLADRIIDTI